MTPQRATHLAFILAVALTVAPCTAQAQSDAAATDTVRLVPEGTITTDTVRLAPEGTITTDTVPTGVIDESQWPDPTITLLKSMLVPGWGQITNKRYVKAGFAIGLETWFITGTIVNWVKANDALEKFRAYPDNIEWFNEYQYYWGNRSDFIWLLGLTVFISMFDAYVDAHLRPYEADTIPGVEPPKGVVLVIPF
jgi:hypothetical protein